VFIFDSMRKLLLISVVLLSCLCSFAQSTEGKYNFVDYPISTIDIQSNEFYSIDVIKRSYINTFVRKVDKRDTVQYYYVLKVYQVTSNNINTFTRPTFVAMFSYENLEMINN